MKIDKSHISYKRGTKRSGANYSRVNLLFDNIFK